MNDTKKKVISKMLDDLIRTAAPKSQTVEKYGGVLYTLKPDEKEGQFCGIFSYKTHVQLSFAKGTELKDPKNLLLGSGKFRRHINFQSPDDIEASAVLGLLKQSARNTA